MQSAYEIKVMQGKATHWNSGKVNSDSSVHVAYKGSSLNSGTKYTWRVRVWDNAGKVSAWSPIAFWQMGLLNSADWKANWIEQGFDEDTITRPTPLFRKEFDARKKIRSATAYITAHGMYEGYINGKRIGDFYLTPGWTSYNKRLQYQAYDVTSLLQAGDNVVGALLGDGWYAGGIGLAQAVFKKPRNIYGAP